MTTATYVTIFFSSALFFNACFGEFNSITSNQSVVEIPPHATCISGKVEHRMAYWREDLGINLFHWHWHMYHPFSGPKFIVNKHRRGEIFYYMHQQMMARFNVERLCNGMSLVPPYFDFDAPIPEGYFPMLSSDVAGKKWTPRLANLKLCNVDRPNDKDGLKVDIQDIKRYVQRIFEGISRKKIIGRNGTEISIDNDQGIDILGNVVEATSILSPNADYYGNPGLHNLGHEAIGFAHDPQNIHQLPAGVMSEPNTAARDTVFYRWHAYLNSIFQKHKDSLRPYDKTALSFPEVHVTNVELCSHRNGKCGNKKNTLYTYMMKSDFNMTRGVDFFRTKPVLVRVMHQNHDEFDYTIECINRSPRQLLGTVRIFMIPVTGDGHMKLSELRHLAIEMDRFVQPLKPGKYKIVRRSTMSSVTIPFEQTYRDLDTNRPKDSEYEELDKFNSCGCGWPHNLLVPRGTAKGYPMLLFAVITDYNKDQPDEDKNGTESNCRISILCSLRHKKYPYKLPNGFPFDRPTRNGIDNVQAFLTPNMATKPVTIFHSDKVRQGRILSNSKPTILESNCNY